MEKPSKFVSAFTFLFRRLLDKRNLLYTCAAVASELNPLVLADERSCEPGNLFAVDRYDELIAVPVAPRDSIAPYFFCHYFSSS